MAVAHAPNDFEVSVITPKAGETKIDIYPARDYQTEAYSRFIEFEKANPNKEFTFEKPSIIMVLSRDTDTGFVKYVRVDGTYAYMITNKSLQIVIEPMKVPKQLTSLQINCLIEFMKLRSLNPLFGHCFYSNMSVGLHSQYKLYVNTIKMTSKIPRRRFEVVKDKDAINDQIFVVFFHHNNEYYMMTYTDDIIPKPNRVYKILMDQQVSYYIDAVKDHDFVNKEIGIEYCKDIPCFEAPEDSNSTCSVCYSNFKNIILNPCKHIDICSLCVSKNDDWKCGICRTKIVSVSPLLEKNITNMPENVSLDALSIIADSENKYQKHIKEIEKKIHTLQQEFNPDKFPEIIAFGNKILCENLEPINASSSAD